MSEYRGAATLPLAALATVTACWIFLTRSTPTLARPTIPGIDADAIIQTAVGPGHLAVLTKVSPNLTAAHKANFAMLLFSGVFCGYANMNIG